VNTETALWKHLKKETARDVHWTRIEARVGAGIPDVNGSFLWPVSGRSRGIEIWCELKVCKTKAYKTAGLWRPAQIAWQTARSFHSRNVWNLVSHPQAEVVKIYSGSRIADLWDDSEGKVEPDMVLRYRNPYDSWSLFLEMAAARSFDAIETSIADRGP
jgi:hypothetical protein